MTEPSKKPGRLARTAAGITHWTLTFGEQRVPPVLRSVLGLVLMLLGAVGGILPVLGFWMVPLGAALIALDIPWTRHKIHAWMPVLEAKARGLSTGGPN